MNLFWGASATEPAPGYYQRVIGVLLLVLARQVPDRAVTGRSCVYSGSNSTLRFSQTILGGVSLWRRRIRMAGNYHDSKPGSTFSWLSSPPVEESYESKLGSNVRACVRAPVRAFVRACVRRKILTRNSYWSPLVKSEKFARSANAYSRSEYV
eukprot:1530689-Rhodomonas_salina.1